MRRPLDHVSADEELRAVWDGCQAAAYLWDDRTYFVLARRAVRLAREAGALTVLSDALDALTGLLLLAGELAEAEALGSALPVAAWRGSDAEASGLIEAGRGEGSATIQWARGVLYNGLGRYEEARSAVAHAAASPAENSCWALSELVEASVRTGNTAAAGNALELLSEMTRAGENDWGMGVEARSRALLAHGPTAEGLYREAIERLGRTRIRVELARAHLLYGEWLRRERRRLEARRELRHAHELFGAFGMPAFAERARI